MTQSTPVGTSTDTSRRLCRVALRIGSDPVGRPDRRAQRRPAVQVLPGERPGRAQAGDVTRILEVAAGRARAGSEVDDVVGDGDDLGLVLDDEDRVSLVAQRHQQAVHPLDVVRVQPDGGLVEDVGDVGEG